MNINSAYRSIISEAVDGKQTIEKILTAFYSKETDPAAEVAKTLARGEFGLGYRNGWRDEHRAAYNSLYELRVPGSYKSRDVARGVRESAFIADDGANQIRVLTAVDSSD
jgi:hypothetical protein